MLMWTCEECEKVMEVIDSGDGTPCWWCPGCGAVLEYLEEDEGDDTFLRECQLKDHGGAY